MRLSFVQRLKNQKHLTVPTRQSQQKFSPPTPSTPYVLKKKESQPAREFNDHHADLKKFLSILQETRNPQNDQNSQTFAQKLKEKKNKQIMNQLYNKQDANQKKNTSRFISNSCQKIDKKQNKLPSIKQHNRNRLIYTQKRSKQNEEQNQENFTFMKINNQKSNYNNITRKIPQKNQKQIDSKSIQQRSCGKRGLENIGNTCYINSVIQCLFHISCFNEYFQKQLYLKENKFIGIKTDSNKMIIQKYRDIYLYVMKGIQNQQGNRSTYSLKLSLSKACSLFIQWQQQDAHEFMRKLLDAMHQQLNRSQNNSPYRILKTKSKLQFSSISALANEYFNYYKLRDDSYIYDILGGQIYNNVKCINCKNQSISFDNCLDISLPLVKGKDKLQQLLQQFFSQQKLCDFYRCQFCNKINKNSTKTTKIWRTPKILIIHLKRSQFGKKNMESIRFPVQFLSLKPFMNNQNQRISNKHSNYTLKSIVCHRGVLQGGHYWSLVKEYGQWYKVDDQNVCTIDQKEMKHQFQHEGNPEPYVLFYEAMNK